VTTGTSSTTETTGTWRRRARAADPKRVALWAVAALVLVHGVSFLALTALQRDQGATVLAGVHVEGTPVGGATRDELTATVEDLAADRLETAVVVATEHTYEPEG
jgi:hypothetical protein